MAEPFNILLSEQVMGKQREKKSWPNDLIQSMELKVLHFASHHAKGERQVSQYSHDFTCFS